VPDVAAQLDALVAGLRAIFGDALVGVYLHGSLLLGGFTARSDVDVLALVSRPTTDGERDALGELVARIANSPRPLELDVLVQSHVRPWRYPVPFDVHYSASGGLEVLGESHDLAAVIAVARTGEGGLVGPAPRDVLPEVPRADYVHAILEDRRELEQIIRRYPGSVVLALARMWADLATGELRSKADAVAWALERLPPEHRAVLERAWEQGDDESWEDAWPAIDAYAAHLTAIIDECLTQPPSPSSAPPP